MIARAPTHAASTRVRSRVAACCDRESRAQSALERQPAAHRCGKCRFHPARGDGDEPAVAVTGIGLRTIGTRCSGLRRAKRGAEDCGLSGVFVLAFQQHGITVTEEAVTLLNRMAVGAADIVHACKGRHQHQQR